jgi:hypothetical protein
VRRVESTHPTRAAKVEEHVADIRGAAPAYRKSFQKNVESDMRMFGSAQNCCGALSCRSIVSEVPQRANGARIRCPYALYARGEYDDATLDTATGPALKTSSAHRQRLRALGSRLAEKERFGSSMSTITNACISHISDGLEDVQAFSIRYPRDYTRIALHAESLRISATVAVVDTPVAQ